MLFINTCQGQTFSEWFRQKKTQKKYLLQQIAALQVYIGYARKGYTIAKDGLSFIGDLKEGELSIHANYFDSLDKINPKLKQYAETSTVVSQQLSMLFEYHNLLKHIKSSNAFSATELNYIKSVLLNITNKHGLAIEELLQVSQDRQWKMSDAARIDKIDQIKDEIEVHYTLFKQFQEDCLLLANSKKRDKKDNSAIRKLYGLEMNLKP